MALVTNSKIDGQKMIFENKESKISPHPPKILIADDEDVIRELFERLLSRQGYKVFTAADGLKTLDMIKENNFDMLILDLKMPKMSGMELLDEIKKLKKDLIIIVITGYATVDTAKKAMRENCFDYITKPFNVEDVNIVIKRAFDIKRLAEQEKKLKVQLERAERLALLAEMGTGMAHEVNTVLTSLKLFLEMLESKSSQAEEAKNISLILEEIERAEKLITRFLNFAKPGEADFIRTDINNVIKRSLQFLKYKFIKHKIKVCYEPGQGLPSVLCDAAKMEEVFLNILSNSIDAMPEGGNLTVKDEAIEERVVITISDTGIGIHSKDLPKVYNPFFTTKPQGTGLGLSITHRIIDEHKGAIFITSQINKGTSVRIELPILSKDAP
ncbi:MAG: response regulator [Candidatus Omnitrophota bacterium]